MIIEGKTYQSKKIDANELCEMERLGMPVTEFLEGKCTGMQNFSFLRGFLAWEMDVDVKTAGKVLGRLLKSEKVMCEIIKEIQFTFAEFLLANAR